LSETLVENKFFVIEKKYIRYANIVLLVLGIGFTHSASRFLDTKFIMTHRAQISLTILKSDMSVCVCCIILFFQIKQAVAALKRGITDITQ